MGEGRQLNPKERTEDVGRDARVGPLSQGTHAVPSKSDLLTSPILGSSITSPRYLFSSWFPLRSKLTHPPPVLSRSPTLLHRARLASSSVSISSLPSLSQHCSNHSKSRITSTRLDSNSSSLVAPPHAPLLPLNRSAPLQPNTHSNPPPKCSTSLQQPVPLPRYRRPARNDQREERKERKRRESGKDKL
ncbi:hypothetical protein BDY24DRAFT_102558 [Mrakia frigida]|uniref:uncharacterized protein n=1 Tax=Mrakia frigida TaxID=29902 RepID=UPI003FCC0046